MNAPGQPEPDGRVALLAAARAELAERGHAGISLRAVARRVGVSHAAPKYHFSDRAALLTAVAAEGFAELAASLRQAPATLPAMGRAYIRFALDSPALFDLMFRPSELHPGDPGLLRAQQDAIGALDVAAAEAEGGEEPPPAPSELAMISWALAHGLAVLTRDGALNSASPGGHSAGAELACHLVDAYTRRITAQPHQAESFPVAQPERQG
jgi:AcrR family transcriptional regulator